MSCDYWCLLHPQGHSAKRRIVKFLLLRMNGGVSFTCRCGAVCGAASLVSSRPRPRRFWMWRHLWSLSGDFPLGSKSPTAHSESANWPQKEALVPAMGERNTTENLFFFFFRFIDGVAKVKLRSKRFNRWRFQWQLFVGTNPLSRKSFHDVTN